MAVNNALNLTATGIITHDGAGTFSGSTVTEGGVLLAGASNAITDTGVLAKGTTLVGDGTTAPTLLSVGTDGFGLIADSSAGPGVAWKILPGAGGGSLVFLNKTTVSMAAATVNFESLITATYPKYLVQLQNVIPETDSRFIGVRFGTGAGPTYQTTGYATAADGAMQGGYGSAVGILLTDASLGSDTNEYGFTGSFILYNPNATGTYPNLSGFGGGHLTTSSIVCGEFYGEWTTAGAITAFQLLTFTNGTTANGNVESGIITVYGIQEA